MRSKIISTLLSLVTLVVVLAGCGGSSGGGGGGGGFVALYATDSMDNNDHVWVTVNKVVLHAASGPQTVFDEPTGVVVDLKTLSDATGAKFQFLSLANVTGGPFTSAAVTMSKDLVVFPKGSFQGVPKQFADKFDDGAGLSTVNFGLTGGGRFGAGDDALVIDFDLKSWADDNNAITPVIKEHNENGLGDDRRHVEDDHEGTVSGLTGTVPNQEFDLVRRNFSFHVRTTGDTVLYNADQSPNPTLANGARVHVRGLFSIASISMVATSIKIQKGADDDKDEIKGAPADVDANGGTFMVTVDEASGFVPGDVKVKVVTTPGTVFRLGRGAHVTRDEFFAALTTAKAVECDGTYDPGTNTLTATRCKLDSDGHHGGGEGVELKGSATNADATAGTFSLTLTEWDGFAGSLGMVVQVATGGDTVFKDKDRKVVDKAAFFAQLATFGHAEVRGTLSGTTVSAKVCQIEN